MTRLLVLGHRGLLGSACVKVLSKYYDVLTTGDERVDLRNKDEVYWLFNRLNPELVVNCAAKVGGVKANRDDPVRYIEDNLTITSNVLAAAHMFKVKKLVNIGTSCLYPKTAPIPVKEESFMTGPFDPDVEAYASAKLVGYFSCRAYRNQHGCNFVTVCPSNIYGPGDNYGESAHVLPALVRKAFEANASNGKVRIWGDGTQVREFIHSFDAAEAIRIVLERYDSPELLNIGSGIGTSINTLALLLSAIVGFAGIEYDRSQPIGIKEKTFDISKITSLGWKPRIDLLTGLKMVCEDYRESIKDGSIRLK